MTRTALLLPSLLIVLAGCRSDGKLDTGTTGDVQPTDADGDGYPDGEDCDDSDASVSPGAEEVCDGLDNDCDGEVDEGVMLTWYTDADGDGYGGEESTQACGAPAGTVEQDGDCDDTDPAYHPGATEDDCTDPNDYNCDGSVAYDDADGDGFPACEDCDDAAGDVNPDADELCDGIDNDCDGDIDEDSAVDASTWYADADGDGYGDVTSAVTSCSAPSGTVADATDCDDAVASTNPAADEVCNGVDDNCDGDVDEDTALDASTWYADADGDGYGDATSAVTSCSAPSGTVADATDCDDAAASTNPAADEVCDEADNDCDGDVDEDSAVDASTWYVDADGDGYGDASSTVLACELPSGASADATDCDDTDSGVNPGATEICSGVDEDCDGNIDDLGPSAVYAGSLTAGEEKHYQYSPVSVGSGYLYANWGAEAAADTYELAVGSTAGDEDILAWTDVGAVTSTTLSGLSLDGAWDGAEYFVSIRAVNGSDSCDLSATSAAVEIAEATTWTGDIADLRDNDDYGGGSADWPEAGVDAVYGEHWFEEVDIDAVTTVLVQGWGEVDGVTTGIDPTDVAVTDPADGWLALYANDITVAGVITASGRGYGGGGGGGAGVRGGYQGEGGEGGLGGDGGAANTSYPGAGGGGSPGGAGGVGATTGGDGNLYGGGGGSTGCSGSDGNDGGDGAVGTVGGTGGTASSGVVGTAGVGEFSAGGGTGVSGCDNWSGGGGGGYGAGGGGGSQWASSTAETSGGGGGGAGGSGGARTVDGADGAGPYAGTGGVGGSYTGTAGTDGGYLAAASNGDTTTDRSLALGSGGGGGSAGYQETGGGGGSAGGGALHLYAYDTLAIESTAYLLANGAGGGGGARDNGGSSTSAAGSVGAGGGIRLEAQSLTIDAVFPYISALGGDGQTSNGGTIKLFYDTLAGTTPDTSAAGRVYDAGTGTWVAP